jgi:N-acetylmuramoyl-L-alanine amidase
MDIIAHPSPNQDSRGGESVRLLVLHYTGMTSGPAALQRLCDPSAKVSAHFLVEEAGVGVWRGCAAVNAASIGIEMINPGHEWGYRPFPDVQMRSLEALCRGILERHAIPPDGVIGHSDMAPTRKQDPGELFDWEALARIGIGMTVPMVTASGHGLGPGDAGAPVAQLQARLAAFGYGLEQTGLYDAPTQAVVSAFQRHFRRAAVTGRADAHMQAVLEALLERYPWPGAVA